MQMLSLLYIPYGHCHVSILNFHIVWYDAPRALILLLTRSLAANVGTKMAAGGGG